LPAAASISAHRGPQGFTEIIRQRAQSVPTDDAGLYRFALLP
jgi:hypothetical protein